MKFTLDLYCFQSLTFEMQTPCTLVPFRCDHWSSLKCFCLNLTKEMFPHGLHSVLLSLKVSPALTGSSFPAPSSKVSAEVAIISQGNFFSRQRKLNTILFNPGSAIKAKVTQKRVYKQGSKHCSERDNEQPCIDMILTTTLLSSVHDNSNTVTISFDEMIEVSKEVVAFTFLQMVAEVKLS